MTIVVPVVATAAGLLLGIGLIAATGSVSRRWQRSGTAWPAPLNVGASINRRWPPLVGLGFIFANRANLTNVGGEGQIAMGGMAATAMALHGTVRLPSGWPCSPARGGALAGALWGGMAGGLQCGAGRTR